MSDRVDTRSRSSANAARSLGAAPRRGTVSVQMVVILVPVLFGLMGFAVDLGRLYMIKGELKVAADSAALAAAARIIGTETSTTDAIAAARLTIETATGYGNKYDFAGNPIGETTGSLVSEMPDPTFYEAVAGATGTSDSGSGEVSGSVARHVKVALRADAPLVFWSFLVSSGERKTPIEVSAVAGMSAPLCTACAIQPLAIAALDPEETIDFGYTLNTKYTFGYSCTGSPTPSGITGATQRIPYLLLNRYDENATVFPEENQQAYRIGAQGLLASTNRAMACVTISTGEGENVWVNAAPRACSQNVASPVSALLCGMYSRFDAAPAEGCSGVAEIDTMATAYLPDIDVADIEEYAAYTGAGQRVITVPIVDALNPVGNMLVLGFRQFLVDPNPDTTTINPTDQNGRFVGLYIGSVAPVKQGSFGGCTQAAGPGKVVLHQ